MQLFTLFALLAINAATHASMLHPIEARQATTGKFCSSVKKTVTSARNCPASATAFCKSYIGTTTITSTAKGTVTTTVTSIITSTESATLCRAPPLKTGVGSKRDAGAVVERDGNVAIEERATVPKPSCLSSYKAGPTLSSACNCLGITKMTSTSTYRPTSTITATVTTFVVSGQAPSPTAFYIYANNGRIAGQYAKVVSNTSVDFLYSYPSSVFSIEAAYLKCTESPYVPPYGYVISNNDPDPVAFAEDGYALTEVEVRFNNDGTCPLFALRNGRGSVSSAKGSSNRWYFGQSVVAGGTGFDVFAVAKV